MSLILAIDAAGPILGVASSRNGSVIHRAERLGPIRHVEALIPQIELALRQGNRKITEYDAIGVAAGPGSFTGLRVGMAAAKALGLGAGIPVISVDTLEAIAVTERFLRGAHPYDGVIVPVLDARKNRFYAAAFHGAAEGDDGGDTRLTADGDLTLEELLEVVSEVTGAGSPGGPAPHASGEASRWCAPGPLASQFVTHGADPAAADRVSSAPGIAILAARRFLAGAAAGPYQGPRYLRSGDIGSQKPAPRFDAHAGVDLES